MIILLIPTIIALVCTTYFTVPIEINTFSTLKRSNEDTSWEQDHHISQWLKSQLITSSMDNY